MALCKDRIVVKAWVMTQTVTVPWSGRQYDKEVALFMKT